jgi:choline kinase
MNDANDRKPKLARALILAAGMGTRLRPLTNDRPKALIAVHGEPLLHRAIRILAGIGIRDVAVVVGHRAEVVRNETGAHRDGATIHYVDAHEYRTTGTAASVLRAADFFDEDTLLIEGDVMFDPSIVAAVAHAGGDAAAVSLLEPGMSGTVATLLSDGSIAKFSRSDVPMAEPRYKTVNVYRFSRSTLGDILIPACESHVATRPMSFFEEVLDDVLKAGRIRIEAVDCAGQRWVEIDDHVDFDLAQRVFA